jgi:hypothetical protein
MFYYNGQYFGFYDDLKTNFTMFNSTPSYLGIGRGINNSAIYRYVVCNSRTTSFSILNSFN